MTARPLLHPIFAAIGALIGAVAIYAVLKADEPMRPLLAGGLGGLALLLASPKPPAPLSLLRDVLILAALGWLARGGLEAWHAPARWIDALHLAKSGGVAAITVYLIVAFMRTLQGQPLPHRAGLFLLAFPLFVKALFLLTSVTLLQSLATMLTFGLVTNPDLLIWIGRSVVLFVVAEAIVSGIGAALDARFDTERDLHLLLLAAAIFAGASIEIADWGSSASTAAMGPLFRLFCVVATSMGSQAALWGLTYVVTGAIIDALRGHRPTARTSVPQWRDGVIKGGIYAGIFMSILHGIAIWRVSPLWNAFLGAAPVIAFAAAGALAFPLAKTVVESFDGSAPFFFRLQIAYRSIWNYVRGLVIGIALGLLWTGAVPFTTGGERFWFGLVTGAVAYAGVDLLHDVVSIALRLRRHIQSSRVYLLGALLGGLIGGALASYLDAPQVQVITEKFQRYVTVFFPGAGFKVDHYVIFPLFSKWGQTDLGPVAGGVRLLFNESLSGVINWSFAAPLFSINLVLLTALVQRDRAPIERLLTRNGFVDVIEQAFRVQRWGLWMAPVIYSFLRLAPDPTWYNQDGAIRSIVATIMDLRQPGPTFHDWSLTLFMGLLGYDWLRVLIWFDHMGLRVATLVNASFVVGDKLDEKAARWLGHGSLTRVIPEGIRRFATWAPLLIPFYIPRGGEWDKVWDGATGVAANPLPLLPPVKVLVTAYVISVSLAVIAVVLVARSWSRKANTHLRNAPQPARISNGIINLETTAEGFARLDVASAVRPGAALDLTKRPVAPSDGRGIFFHIREADRVLSHVIDPGRMTRATPTALEFASDAEGLTINAEVKALAATPAILSTLKLTNVGESKRILSLSSFREIALADWDSYERHPSYQALFIGTSFVPPLNAIIAHNRKLKEDRRREVFVHAAAWDDQNKVTLLGYQDSRSIFLGAGPSAAPDGTLNEPDDEGTAYSFDPAACLALSVTLEAGDTIEIRFLDGYATSDTVAAQMAARQLNVAAVAEDVLDAIFKTIRPTRDRAASPAALPQFSGDRTALTLSWDTARPMSHVLANRFGGGVVIGNDGSLFSFARNSQQNSLTPFILESAPAQRLGQAIYVKDLATGDIVTPGFVPYRYADANHTVQFERGAATLSMIRGDLALDHRIVMPPDAPVELRLLTVRNRSAEAKRYRVTSYFEIVLGELPQDSARSLALVDGAPSNALFFENEKSPFAAGTAFVATSLTEPEREIWRGRFIGPSNSLLTPALAQGPIADDADFSDKARCAAFSGEIEVPAGGEARIAMMLGQADTPDAAKALIAEYASPDRVAQADGETARYWRDFSSTLRIETTDPAFDALVNEWLPYQVVAARLWARLGPNQRSGGYGFRDQLQDVLPLSILKPELAREQILLHAAQQFLDGDVLQWWHNDRDGNTGLGARNRASDPHMWLPYLVAQYVSVTGDAGILDESVRYLEGMPIPPGQEGIAFAPRASRDRAPLFDHCRRAIERTLKAQGVHGLPLMGTGDWNDGLSHVGAKGKGESVWLGFFLHDVLRRFVPLCERRDERDLATRWTTAQSALKTALDGMWRGQGYVRAITDKGEEMLFADALVASWPVLSRASESSRGVAALNFAREALDKGTLVALLDPAFTPASKPKPGRISDYPPGVRENGGQYSHGVSWLIDAHAVLADMRDEEGDAVGAAELRAHAASLWRKISPLERDGADRLPPHQQPADIYFGPGYEGRGGWTWYTGAAARMLWAAYEMLGIRVENGALALAPHAFTPKGALTLTSVSYKGRSHRP